jgi:excisionase family DNA binding protein
VDDLDDLDDLDDMDDTQWLTLPEVADRLGVRLGQVRRMLADRELLAVRRGERNALSVPAVLLGPDGPLPDLPGTLTVLADNGVVDEEAFTWLFSDDPSIVGGSPVKALLAGHKTEVRRRAQALG